MKGPTGTTSSSTACLNCRSGISTWKPYHGPSSLQPASCHNFEMPEILPHTCERALLEQFLKAESMALWLVRSAQTQDVPPGVLQFLRRHEEEEDRHLRQFEQLLGTASRGRAALPRVPSEWRVLAVHLYGYEALGLEFAKLL